MVVGKPANALQAAANAGRAYSSCASDASEARLPHDVTIVGMSWKDTPKFVALGLPKCAVTKQSTAVLVSSLLVVGAMAGLAQYTFVSGSLKSREKY